MQRKVVELHNRGMRRDDSISKTSNEFAFHNHNIRITARDNNTLLSITNEKGNSEITFKSGSVTGYFLGHCIIGEYLIIFAKNDSKVDTIFRVEEVNGEFYSTILYNGDLGFDTKYPIEALPYYITEDIQNVYWVDGKNQPRVINIKKTYNSQSTFDFLPKVKNITKISVDKTYGVGYFPSGVIQYFISYYNKYGPETRIVAASSLSYSSIEDRGASPEEYTNSIFNINISDVDTSFEYLRVYSIFRTSLDNTVVAKLVKDIAIDGLSTINLVDNNSTGEAIDPTELLFTGGDYIVASTIAQKDNTLFLGDLKVSNITLNKSSEELIQSALKDSMLFSLREVPKFISNDLYPYENQLKYSSDKIKSFKGGETYRVGIQFKNKYGVWSEPVFLKDIRNNLYPKSDNDYIYLPKLYLRIPTDNNALSEVLKDYVSARLLYVEPNFANRSVVAQGIINPTLFNVQERKENKPWCLASWFTRPIPSDKQSEDTIEYRHYEPLKSNNSIYGEIQSVESAKKPYIKLYNVDTTKDISILYSYNSMSGTCDVDIAYKDKIYNWGDNGKIWYVCHDSIKSFYVSVGGTGTSDSVFEDKIHAATGIGRQYIIKFSTLTNQSLSGFHMTNVVPYTWDDLDLTGIDSFEERSAKNPNQYYIDWNTITLNSPDINDDTIYLDNKQYKFRIVGYCPITSNIGDYKIAASSPIDKSMKGTLNVSFNKFYSKGSKTNTLWSYPLWNDVNWERPSSGESKASYTLGLGTAFVIYPWHKSGSINGHDNLNFSVVDSLKEEPISSILESKTFANKRISDSTFYFDKNDIWSAWTYGSDFNKGITPIRIVNQDTPSLYQLYQYTEGLEYNSNKTYLGNYNKIVTSDSDYALYNIGEVPNAKVENYLNNKFVPDNYTTNYDSCQVAFKSSPHAVFSFNSTAYNQIVIPPSSLIGSIDPNLQDITQLRLWYSRNIASMLTNVGVLKYLGGWGISEEQDSNISIGEYILVRKGSLIQGDTITYHLYKKITTGAETIEANYEEVVDTKMVLDSNGVYIYFDTDNNTSYSLLTSNLIYQSLGGVSSIDTESPYVLIGELYLEDSYGESHLYGDSNSVTLKTHTWIPIGKETELEWDLDYIDVDATEGDTYYQRWDCVKTLPNSGENNIIDITSIMIETRTNLDGRYDLYRRATDLVELDYNVFNSINSVYSQSNNYLKYNMLDEQFDSIDYSNQFVWSLNKETASQIDSWTSINLASSYALDGNLGKITCIKRFNDNLIAFQQRGLSQILFNSRTQISTTEGVPIEIANSGKVDGVRYISESVGCNNKWSICNTPYGIYFVDDYNKSINLFNGQLESLSKAKGFNVWIKNQSNLNTWNPVHFSNFKTSYDSINNDVYFINKDYCLVYSELLKEFTSFMDYNEVPMITSFKDYIVSYKNYRLWEHNAGDYNYFFGNYKPYFIEYKVTPNQYSDKIFTNIEYRADMWDSNNNLTNGTFDYLSVHNEYQEGSTLLKNNTKYPSFKKKFRIWRADIPRDSFNKRDRIRNPWINLQLGKNENNKDRMEFHNLLVYYYE